MFFWAQHSIVRLLVREVFLHQERPWHRTLGLLQETQAGDVACWMNSWCLEVVFAPHSRVEKRESGAGSSWTDSSLSQSERKDKCRRAGPCLSRHSAANRCTRAIKTAELYFDETYIPQRLSLFFHPRSLIKTQPNM